MPTSGVPTAGVPTIGVEEEYLLLDPATGAPVPVGGAVLRRAGRDPAGPDAELQHELVQVQVEMATPVCTTAAEVREHVTAARASLAAAAREEGVLLAPVGIAPVGSDAAVTRDERYLAIRDAAPGLAAEQLISGMHVHVAVPDRATGAAVLNGVRPWLHVLLALSANSPLRRGRDTGFASWRTVQAQRWPVEGAPPHVRDERDYDRRVAALLATGAVLDRGQLYWQARLSDSYPTVELRSADVALDVDTAVLLAVLTRALVATLAARPGNSEEGVDAELLRAASWQAARHGLGGELVDLRHGAPVRRPADVVLDGLLDAVGPALDAAGDLDLARAGVADALRTGGGAARQRAALADGGLPAVLALFRDATG